MINPLGYEADIVTLSDVVTKAREAVDVAKAAVKAQKETLVANTREIAAFTARIEKITKQNQGFELEIKRLNNDIEKVGSWGHSQITSRKFDTKSPSPVTLKWLFTYTV